MASRAAILWRTCVSGPTLGSYRPPSLGFCVPRHSFTQNPTEVCITDDDLAALNYLYPVCENAAVPHASRLKVGRGRVSEYATRAFLASLMTAVLLQYPERNRSPPEASCRARTME